MSQQDDTDTDGNAERLTFRDDPGSSRSTWIAVVIVLLAVGWFSSGMLGQDDAAAPMTDVATSPVQVAVMTSVAGSVAEVLIVEGQATPERETEVLAEMSGSVVEVPVEKGVTVEAGDVIARLDASGPEARVRRAEAEVERAEREYRNARELVDRGISTLDRLSSASAALAAAEAQLVDAEEALDDTVIRAPFAGRLEGLTVNSGEFVASGVSVARIVDNSPLTVRARVAQQSVSRIVTGEAASVTFITGETRTGTVTFVGANADPQTRTFLLEVEVENADASIRSGVSAEIRIETGETKAHFVSPALLALDERGALGLKTVGDDDIVGFHEVDVVKAETDGVWVSGLPETARIITVGQGFVSEGEEVAARDESELGIGRVRNLPDVVESEP